MIFERGTKCLELWGPSFRIPRQRINVINFDMDISWGGDHAPSFFWYVAIFGQRIFEIHWYDIRHEDAHD